MILKKYPLKKIWKFNWGEFFVLITPKQCCTRIKMARNIMDATIYPIKKSLDIKSLYLSKDGVTFLKTETIIASFSI